MPAPWGYERQDERGPRGWLARRWLRRRTRRVAERLDQVKRQADHSAPVDPSPAEGRTGERAARGVHAVRARQRPAAPGGGRAFLPLTKRVVRQQGLEPRTR